jgi:hypothetical protein
VNLAEVWIANAPRNCTQGDECQDTLLPDGPNSGAFCQADFNFPMESFGTAVLGSFPPVKICQASKFFENIGVQSVFLLIDDATFTRCLAEHDAFTVGGTFPSYSNRFSCGLPTPTP